MRLHLKDIPSQEELDQEAFFRVLLETRPTDPEERRLWKNITFAHHYGIDRYNLASALEALEMTQQLRARGLRRQRIRYITIATLVVAALAYALWRL